jgi:hypothetical protein
LEENGMKEVAIANLVCAVICAKWALDLGFSQFRQVLFMLGGILFGPVMLLILYVRLVYKVKKEGRSGGNMF